MWLAADMYNSDDPAVREAVRDLASGQPFVDTDGALKTDMTPTEAQAFREWATETIRGGDDAQGPAYGDEDQIGAGADDISHPSHGISLEGRR